MPARDNESVIVVALRLQHVYAPVKAKLIPILALRNTTNQYLKKDKNFD